MTDPNEDGPFTPEEWEIINQRCPTLAKVRANRFALYDKQTLIREQLSVQEAAMEKRVLGSLMFWPLRR